MAIKRKTHLNLSGSHHTLDSDNGFIGGTLYVTGSLSASSGITGSIRYIDGASTPFITGSGPNIITNYNSSGQWEITGSGGGTPAGSNTQIQFNNDGAFGASSLLTYNTASVGGLAADTLSAPTASFQFLSGTNSSTFLSGLGAGDAIVVNSNAVLTNSVMAFDGVDPANDVGGLLLQNGAGIIAASGSYNGSNDIFSVNPASTPNHAEARIRGTFTVTSGAYTGTNQIFKISPADTTDEADVEALAKTFKINGFDFVPLWNHATTSLLAPNTNLSGSLLSDLMPSSGIGLFDLNVIAADTNQTNYASWRTIVTMTSSNAGGINVAGVTELDNILVGSDAASWDVNINGDEIEVTGSLTLGGSVYWMAKLTQKMILSSSGQVRY